MKEGEELLADAVEHATSDEARKEFEHLLSVIKKVELEHHEYELLSVQRFWWRSGIGDRRGSNGKG